MENLSFFLYLVYLDPINTDTIFILFLRSIPNVNLVVSFKFSGSWLKST